MSFDENPFFKRRAGMFGHRSAEHAWLWERTWGKLIVLAPILFWLGFLTVNAIKDTGAGKSLKADFSAACLAQHPAAACEDALDEHHFVCFNIAERRKRGEYTSRYDGARYVECMQRRMLGLTATPPRPREQ